MSHRSKKPVFTREELGVNPFVSALKIPVTKINKHGQFKVSGKDKYGKALLVPVEVDLEYTPNTKVFGGPERRKIVMALSPRAIRLYLWVIYRIGSNEDFVWVNRSAFMKEADVSSKNTYLDALRELIRYGILAHTIKQGVYWINPDFLFRGDRIRKFKDNVEYRNEEAFLGLMDEDE